MFDFSIGFIDKVKWCCDLFLSHECNRFVLKKFVLQTDSDLSALSLHEPSPEEKDEAERLKNKGGLCAEFSLVMSFVFIL